MAAKVPLVIRIDQDLKDRVVEEYPGKTVTESVVAALESSIGEGRRSANLPTFPPGIVTKEELDKIIGELKEDIESLKDNLDSIANQIE